ncbi:hypothetical protein FRC00_002214, partial [Tulasnella sp. 408]
MLGRQWLVYYSKRGGSGLDARRWTQLKRYLGAQRWGLEPILDDVLPSLLQIGLIIFCASLLLYLRHLSPAISLARRSITAFLKQSDQSKYYYRGRLRIRLQELKEQV